MSNEYTKALEALRALACHDCKGGGFQVSPIPTFHIGQVQYIDPTPCSTCKGLGFKPNTLAKLAQFQVLVAAWPILAFAGAKVGNQGDKTS